MNFALSAQRLLATLLLVTSAASAAFGQGDETGPIRIEADTLTHEAARDLVEASGNVRINGRGITLLSDQARLNTGSEEAEASGNVILMRDGDLLRAQRLKLNYQDETGEVDSGDAFIRKGNFHLRAARMIKAGPESYHVERGSFTTCDGDTPSWKFSASDVDVTLGDYATGRNALFYLADVPVFYFPYLVFPVKRERQSGFLTPRGGNSSKKGFTFNLGYYWAISPSQDATITLDIQTKRGEGLGLDYRYLLTRGSEGSFRGYVIYDTTQQRFRGEVSQKHVQNFSDTLDLKSDINLVSDRNFYRDFAEQTGVYNQNSLESTLSLTKRFHRQVLSGEFRYMEDLRDNIADNSKTLQKLPTITLTGIRQQLGSLPLFLSYDSSFTNFYREDGIRGERLALQPTLTAYGKVDALELSAWAGYQERLYNAYGGDIGKGYHGVGLFTAGGTVSSTLARVYETGNAAMPRLRHVLIPEIRYNFVQDKNQETVPFFDYYDRVVHENRIVYSLTNYLTGKFVGSDGSSEYRDLLYLRLSQGYEFSGTRRDLLTLVDDRHPFTDVMLDAAAQPLKQLSLGLDARYNPYQSHFSTAGVSADFHDDDGNALGFGYRFARGQVNYLEGKAVVALVKPFTFTYTGRYSADLGDFLESSYALEYRHQCWSVTFSYRDRLDNREFFVNFALAGIGSLGSIRAF